MNDAAPMGGLHGIEHLLRQGQRLGNGQRPLQRLALDVLHHEVVGPDVVQRANVRVIQLRDGSRFALEALAERAQVLLDCDDAIQASVAGFVDLAHAAGANGGEDLVRPESEAGRQ